MPWPHADADRPSMSVGVATMAGHERAPADDLFRRADEALYASKRGGRGRVTSDRAFAGAA
jgi:PleD family two-component response regulator